MIEMRSERLRVERERAVFLEYKGERIGGAGRPPGPVPRSALPHAKAAAAKLERAKPGRPDQTGSA